ncbi:MAG: PAS domain S-box protein [Dehalococcoidales bacterium]|nr:PAS domain S-box protein [Dehalococcoidales bacterium]
MRQFLLMAEREKIKQAKGKPKIQKPWSPLLFILVIVITIEVVIAGGYFLYQIQEQEGFNAAERELDAVSRMKTAQVSQWRAEKISHANSVMNSALLIENVAGLIGSPGDAAATRAVFNELNGMEESFLYQDICLVDVDGNVLAGLDTDRGSIPSFLTSHLARALSGRQAVWVDIDVFRVDGSPETNIIAPLFSQRENGMTALGAVVFSLDPRQYLYPMIQSWPVASYSGETMLVEQRGDSAVYLNISPHQSGGNTALEVPLENKSDVAVMAVQGSEGIYSGVDYRGSKVLSAIAPVPGSPWYLVSKIDSNEIFSMWNLGGTLTIGSTLVVLIIILIIVAFFWQRKQHMLYQAIAQENTKRKTLLNPFEYLVKYANDIILICDEQGKIVQVNDRALEIYGYKRAEFLGSTLASLVAPENLNSFQVLLNKMRETGSATAESLHKRKDGTSVPVEVSARYFQIEEKIYLQAIIRDITDRRAREEEINKLNASLEERVRERTSQLENANKELESFAYSVSHDLRAPLRGIDSWSQVLVEDYKDKLGEKGFGILNRIRAETQRMGQLIEDLLRFSRDTRSEIKWQDVDMTALVTTITTRLQQANPVRKIEFVIQQGLTSKGDPHLLEIALTNLLDNAVKFTANIPQAHILFGEVYRQNKRTFFVRDNGVGFDMEYANKLFKVFQRLHKSSQYPGTGIGLATVQRIISRHSGQVWAESKVNEGASFYFTLKEPSGE